MGGSRKVGGLVRGRGRHSGTWSSLEGLIVRTRLPNSLCPGITAVIRMNSCLLGGTEQTYNTSSKHMIVLGKGKPERSSWGWVVKQRFS